VPEILLTEKTRSIGCSYAGKWLPDFSALSSLGFDRLESSPREAMVKKVQSHDLAGRERLFVEIRLKKSCIELTYSCIKGADDDLRRLHATLLLLRVLRLLPNIRTDAAALSEFLLPSLEISSDIATQPYELLHKKYADLKADHEAACMQKSRIMRTSEEEARRSLKLESDLEALRDRVRKLEAISDSALCESLLSWVSVHRGELDLAVFSEARKIPLSRCEEGLGILLEQGSLIRLRGGAFQPAPNTAKRSFGVMPRGVFSLYWNSYIPMRTKLRKALSFLARKKSGPGLRIK